MESEEVVSIFLCGVCMNGEGLEGLVVAFLIARVVR